MAYAPLVLIGMNLVYALSAYRFDRLSDSISHSKLLASGLVVRIVAGLALSRDGQGWIAVGVALWGPHMGMTQGLLAAMVATTAPAGLRGAAFSAAALSALLLLEAVQARQAA